MKNPYQRALLLHSVFETKSETVQIGLMLRDHITIAVDGLGVAIVNTILSVIKVLVGKKGASSIRPIRSIFKKPKGKQPLKKKILTVVDPLTGQQKKVKTF